MSRALYCTGGGVIAAMGVAVLGMLLAGQPRHCKTVFCNGTKGIFADRLTDVFMPIVNFNGTGTFLEAATNPEVSAVGSAGISYAFASAAWSGAVDFRGAPSILPDESACYLSDQLQTKTTTLAGYTITVNGGVAISSATEYSKVLPDGLQIYTVGETYCSVWLKEPTALVYFDGTDYLGCGVSAPGWLGFYCVLGFRGDVSKLIVVARCPVASDTPGVGVAGACIPPTGTAYVQCAPADPVDAVPVQVMRIPLTAMPAPTIHVYSDGGYISFVSWILPSDLDEEGWGLVGDCVLFGCVQPTSGTRIDDADCYDTLEDAHVDIKQCRFAYAVFPVVGYIAVTGLTSPGMYQDDGIVLSRATVQGGILGGLGVIAETSESGSRRNYAAFSITHFASYTVSAQAEPAIFDGVDVYPTTEDENVLVRMVGGVSIGKTFSVLDQTFYAISECYYRAPYNAACGNIGSGLNDCFANQQGGTCICCVITVNGEELNTKQDITDCALCTGTVLAPTSGIDACRCDLPESTPVWVAQSTTILHISGALKNPGLHLSCVQTPASSAKGTMYQSAYACWTDINNCADGYDLVSLDPTEPQSSQTRFACFSREPDWSLSSKCGDQTTTCTSQTSPGLDQGDAWAYACRCIYQTSKADPGVYGLAIGPTKGWYDMSATGGHAGPLIYPTQFANATKIGNYNLKHYMCLMRPSKTSICRPPANTDPYIHCPLGQQGTAYALQWYELSDFRSNENTESWGDDAFTSIATVPPGASHYVNSDGGNTDLWASFCGCRGAPYQDNMYPNAVQPTSCTS
jgi:hypothetical protein